MTLCTHDLDTRRDEAVQEVLKVAGPEASRESDLGHVRYREPGGRVVLLAV